MDNDKILELFKYCDFDYLNCDTVDEDVLNYLPKDFDYTWSVGASKIAIIPNKEDYVIKLPLKGKYYGEEEEEDFENFDRFYVPGLPESHEYDHCARELELYSKAKKEHVSSILLKNTYIGEVGGEPVYIQKKAVTFCNYYKKEIDDDEKLKSVHTKEEAESMKRSYKKSNVWIRNTGNRFNVWLIDVHKYYGEKQFIKILQFIDNYIDDLHSGNIGYIGDRPVIIDYASFYG